MPAPMAASSRTCCVAADGARRRRPRAWTLAADALGLSYRHCGVPEDWIFIAATLRRRARAMRAAIGRRMAEIQAAREATPADPRPHRRLDLRQSRRASKAWELIDRAGCRGLRRGGAMVSEKHANFLINTGDATAAELEALGEEVRRRVFAADRHRALEWEIRRIGVPLAAGGRRHEPKRVAVLMGGWSSEREVSLVSGRECAAALQSLGYDVRDDRRDARSRRAARGADAHARRRLQRAPRPRRRGRHDPGRARVPAHPLHPFRRARLGGRDAQADREARLRRRRPAARRGRW